jgi:DegV family protein with EDD domain
MARVAVVTDSASDLPADVAAATGITVVPLIVSFGDRSYRTGTEISTEEFYRQLTAPGAPFPTTAAASPGEFQAVFQRLLDEGAEAVVCVTVGGKLSATLKSAQIAAGVVGGHRVRTIDSQTASMSQGLLAMLAAELATAGGTADEIAEAVERRIPDSRLYFALETLEYLKRGGRISGARAALGTVLNVKPIITIEDGIVEPTDRVRTRGKARERLLELLTTQPIERAAVIHVLSPDADVFADELAARANLDRSSILVVPVGPSVAPHVGPGAYGAVILRKPAAA